MLMNNSAKTVRKYSPILSMTGIKYNQERFPLNTRAAQKNINSTCPLFSDRRTSVSGGHQQTYKLLPLR
jgi:hypothetical protein